MADTVSRALGTRILSARFLGARRSGLSLRERAALGITGVAAHREASGDEVDDRDKKRKAEHDENNIDPGRRTGDFRLFGRNFAILNDVDRIVGHLQRAIDAEKRGNEVPDRDNAVDNAVRQIDKSRPQNMHIYPTKHREDRFYEDPRREHHRYKADRQKRECVEKIDLFRKRRRVCVA